MATVADVIGVIQLDFPNASDTEILSCLQQVHNEICFDYKLKPALGTITTLAVGTREYALPASTARVDQVRYRNSATREDFTVLQPTHIDELDTLDVRWRARANGKPQQFYIQAGNIGLVPPPDTATSGSYPQIELDVSQYEILTAGTTLPTSVVSHQAWVEGAKARIALRYEDQRYAVYQRAFEMERKRLAHQLNSFSRQFKVQFLPNSTMGGRRRV